jgi:hypothetical protein
MAEDDMYVKTERMGNDEVWFKPWYYYRIRIAGLRKTLQPHDGQYIVDIGREFNLLGCL